MNLIPFSSFTVLNHALALKQFFMPRVAPQISPFAELPLQLQALKTSWGL